MRGRSHGKRFSRQSVRRHLQVRRCATSFHIARRRAPGTGFRIVKGFILLALRQTDDALRSALRWSKMLGSSAKKGWLLRIASMQPELTRACDEGMLEEIGEDPAISKLAPELLDGAVQPCGVGFFVWSTVLAYNAEKLKTAPQGWADFWDVEKIPGKRGLRKGAKYTLEFALMADGVEPKDVYSVLESKAGQDRAFAKLDKLKPYIQWWEAGAQPPQYLASGDVVMSSAYNGRIAAVQKESNLRIVWNGGIYDMDAFTIPKGAKNREEGLRFIQSVLQPEAQKAYAHQIAYGPVNRAAVPMVDAIRRSNMPTDEANLARQVAISASFWADHGDQLEQRFNSWAAKQ
ncbi:ABC transporter substrate-binding protein [Pseudomonas sp. D8002]|nr:ABC transporter substrate-binding protein [Pseudomonas sp. D8002]NWB21058.1 ABC transporter substrate-binding protein [Pseudomonas sp. D4002]